MTRHKVYVCGSGSYLPGAPIPFTDIETVLGELTGAPPKIRKWMARTNELMGELLDIEYVHYGIDPVTREFTEDNISMAVKAARKALEAAGMQPGDIDLICYGAAHQDQMPTASVRIQEELGIEVCDEFAIHANCTSAYKAMYLAHRLIESGRNTNALVLSSSMASSELRAEYYNQALVDKESLFLRWFLSDGAGAAIMSADRSAAKGFAVETTYIESIGGKRSPLMYNHRPALWLNPKKEYEEGLHHLRQNFRNALSSEIFQEEGGSIFFNGLRRMLAERSISGDSIRCFQINLPAKHIVQSIMDECRELGISDEAYYSRLDQLGYCGPPMVFICLDRILREEQFAPQDRVVSFVTEVSKFMQAGYVLQYDPA